MASPGASLALCLNRGLELEEARQNPPATDRYRAAPHLLERHFAPGLHKVILEAVGLELGSWMAFRAAVLEACLGECCVCAASRCAWSMD
jgi:hypothetical protein